jgi:probable rRNA maturation factor
MVELSFTRNHIASLSMPFLSLEVYADDGVLPKERMYHLHSLIEKAWPAFMAVADKENLYESLELNLKRKVLEVELVWTDNTTMQALNHQYRQKEQPTDVLTFTLLADAPDPSLWMSLPVLQLGSIFISIEYAIAAVQQLPPGTSMESYLIERFVHGLLHLFGMHHDTMEKYEKVLSIQRQVLDIVFQQPSS